MAKKRVTAMLTAAVLAGSMAMMMPQTAVAATTEVLVLGDSISTGYGLAKDETAYFDYMGDVLNAKVTNLAVDGATTFDLLDVVSDSGNEDAIRKADVICISIGGNDLIKAARKVTSDYIINKAGQEEGQKIIDSVDTDNLSIASVKEIMSKISEIGGSGDDYIGKMSTGLRNPRKDAGKNVTTILEKLKAENPKAKIVLQTIYNPMDLPESMINSDKYTDGDRENLATLQSWMRGQLRLLNNLYLENTGVIFADVCGAFADTGWLYIRTMSGDIHPTALGHGLIAATIMDAAGLSHGKTAAITQMLEKQTLSTYQTIPEDDMAVLQAYGDGVQTWTLGDVDGDNEVNVSDALAVMIDYADMLALKQRQGDLPYWKYRAGDIDENGKTSVEDALMIMRYYADRLALKNPTWEQIRGSAE